MAKIAQRLQRRDFAFNRNYAGIKRRVHLSENDFVDQQFWHHRAADFVERCAALLPALHALAVLLPEVSGQLLHAGVEEVGILKHLVVEIVLGIDVERARLDAHIDVLRHQRDVPFGLFFLQMQADRDDLVVGFSGGKRCGQLHADRLGLQEQTPGRRTVRSFGQRNAVLDAVLKPAHQVIEKTRGLPRVAIDF